MSDREPLVEAASRSASPALTRRKGCRPSARNVRPVLPGTRFRQEEEVPPAYAGGKEKKE